MLSTILWIIGGLVALALVGYFLIAVLFFKVFAKAWKEINK